MTMHAFTPHVQARFRRFRSLVAFTRSLAAACRAADPVPFSGGLRLWLLIIGACLGLFQAGCSGVSSTTRRAGQVGVGSAVGGLAGYVAGKGKPMAVAGGAVAGALVTDLALGSDPEVEQRGFDQGYVQGQSDAIKRQYFLRQAMEERPLRGQRERTTSYYVPAPALSPEGTRQQPQLLELRVKE